MTMTTIQPKDRSRKRRRPVHHNNSQIGNPGQRREDSREGRNRSTGSNSSRTGKSSFASVLLSLALLFSGDNAYHEATFADAADVEASNHVRHPDLLNDDPEEQQQPHHHRHHEQLEQQGEQSQSGQIHRRNSGLKKEVIGHYASWQFYNRNGMTKPENIDFTKLSRINYKFQTDERGNIFGSDKFADPQMLFGPVDWNPPPNSNEYCHRFSANQSPTCQYHHYEEGLIGRAHMNGCLVYVTIGGSMGTSTGAQSGEEISPFLELARDPLARINFATNCKWIMTNYNFDGIDIDFEVQGHNAQPITAEDMASYSLLLSEVRDSLFELGTENRQKYGLTSSLPCHPESIDNLDVVFLDSVLSEFNLMTYDFHGPWKGVILPSAPLFDGTDDGSSSAPDLSVDSCVQTYLRRGASPQKLNIALPFFGRSYRTINGATAVGDIGQSCNLNWAGECSDTTTWSDNAGSPEYYHIFKKLPALTRYWDENTQSVLGYSNQGVVSFDNEHSICLKVEYMVNRQLNGVIVRDLTGDMLDDLTMPLLDAVNTKLDNREVGCESIDFSKKLNKGPTSSRYVCGLGEMDAKERCSSWDLEEVSCSSGTGCPANQHCFLTECEKPDPEEEKSISQNDSTPASSASASSSIESSGPSFHYTCGYGQGDASLRCNDMHWEDISCEHGSCPNGMICFVVECDKGKKAEDQQKFIQQNFKKPKPKRKPARKKPTSSIVTSSSSSKSYSSSSSGSSSSNSSAGRSAHCGINYDHAKSCGLPCPLGNECPLGQFCFWLKCGSSAPKSVSSSSGSSGITAMKYQCGETRKEALMCMEECGLGWTCPSGKDCYNVPCSV